MRVVRARNRRTFLEFCNLKTSPEMYSASVISGRARKLNIEPINADECRFPLADELLENRSPGVP